MLHTPVMACMSTHTQHENLHGILYILYTVLRCALQYIYICTLQSTVIRLHGHLRPAHCLGDFKIRFADDRGKTVRISPKTTTSTTTTIEVVSACLSFLFTPYFYFILFLLFKINRRRNDARIKLYSDCD